MNFEVNINEKRGREVGEVISSEILINNVEDGLDLLGDVYYQGVEVLIMKEENFHPTFFDLSLGTAGEILQKFSNLRMRLIIICDYAKFEQKSMQDFIRETNNGDLVNFVKTEDEAYLRI